MTSGSMRAPRRRALALIPGMLATFAALLVPAAADARLGDAALGEGARGKDVRQLQRALCRAGFHTAVDGVFGSSTHARVRRFERAQRRRVDGVVSRADARALRRLARANATQAGGGAVAGELPEQADVPSSTPGSSARLTPQGLAIPPADAPPKIRAAIRAGNQIAKRPYKWGGGHGRLRDSGYDCSGSISYALRKAGLMSYALNSTGFMGWGRRGKGRWITIRANAGHAYMIIAGLRFDTSARRQTGSRWSARMRSPRGYRATHPVGL